MFVQTTVFTPSSLLGIANSFWPGNPMQVFITVHAEYLFQLVLPIVFVGLTGARADGRSLIAVPPSLGGRPLTIF